MSRPLEHYAMIGDGETAALVNRDGGVDWLCWPRFDSDACFAALLGKPEHGTWSFVPVQPLVRRERRYQPDTLVLETDLHTASGAVRLIDFMPRRDGPSTLVRIVVGLHGTVPLQMELVLRFGYGLVAPWIERNAGGLLARIGSDLVCLHAPVALAIRDERAHAEVAVGEGDRLAFVLRHTHADQPSPGRIDAEAALVATQRFWRDWIGRFDDRRTRWPGAVRRSLITLKALVHQPSGGLVAAPTTSLPEAPGGTLNWDYRYCWLRDASFATTCLVNAGFLDEATRWRDWALRALGGDPAAMQIMYRVDGGRQINEYEIPILPGWRYARPVRSGNAAVGQHQLDVYGELLYALELGQQAGIAATPEQERVCRRTAEHLEEVWDSGGSSVWESRGEQRRYTYSKAMACVALDRFVQRRGAAEAAPVARLARLRDTIRAAVLEEGWNEGLGHFTQYFGGQQVDASLLLLPLVGFLPAADPRMAATIDAVGRKLGEGGLIRRTERKTDGPSEGAFLACSCWMADCLDLLGRHDEAVAQFERLLAVGNDVGLFSEEYDVPGRHLSGNFPQALTHLSVVNTALGLCGPVLARGGG